MAKIFPVLAAGQRMLDISADCRINVTSGRLVVPERGIWGEQVFIVKYLHCLIEAPLLICVNLFIIISGYYGLKLKLRNIINIGILVSSVFLLNIFTLRKMDKQISQ